VCPARNKIYPDKAEQVIESMLKNPEEICSQVQGVGDLDGRRSKEVSVSDESPSKSICPLGGSAPIAPMKRSFVKARGPDVKYISAA
jgi:hypothetical protein